MTRRPIILFLFIVAFLAAGGYWLALSMDGAEIGPGLLIVQFAPMLAAFITALLSRRNLRGFGWGWGKWRYQVAAYFLPFAIALVSFSLVWGLGFGSIDAGPVSEEAKAAIADMFGVTLTSDATTLMALVVLNGTLGLLFAFGAVGEELGWRGFLTPELMKHHSYTSASIIGGTIWTVYHFPLLIWAVAPNLGAATWPLLLSTLLGGIALTFILNWLRMKSGSVWTAVIFHATLNSHIHGFFQNLTIPTSEWTKYVSGEYGFFVGMVSAVVALMFWLQRRAIDETSGSRTAGRSRRPLRGLLSLALLLIALLFPGHDGAQAQTNGIPKVANTSSPRATLETFLDSVDTFMDLSLDATLSYEESDRFYPNDREKRLHALAEEQFAKAVDTLDLSELPSGFRRALAIESLVRMTDVLARVQLPALPDVPDHETMKAGGETRWRIPETRIEIALVNEGARAGEYLFSAQTVANLKDIHQRVAQLPPRQGSVKRYLDGLSPYTTDTTLHDLWRNSAVTFGVLPERWSLEMPDWLKAHFLGATVWQWISFTVCDAAGLLLVWLSWHLGGRWGASRQMRVFVTALFFLVYTSLAITILQVLQIGGTLLFVVGLATVVMFYLSAIGVAFAGANAIAEAIIKRQKLRTGGVDSQLIRLGARLIALALTTALVIRGTNELGFPAYSLLTGLGVSGLAIALAARDTLSNLLGSIAIMFEKPFRSHDWIKVADAEGSVERVGFRSTRIRTFEDSVVSIPNNLIVTTMVDNLGARGRRHQRLVVNLPHGTRLDCVRSFIDGIRTILSRHDMTQGEDHRVHLNEFNEGGLGVLIDFHLHAPSYDIELREREAILFDILGLAESLDIKLNEES